MPAPGDIIASKYRLDRLVGKGAFASVWAATNTLIDRQIALKLLHPQVAADPTAVARLLREAKLAAKSFHPTLVHVEDIGQTERGRPFLVMEYLHGHSLSVILRRKGKLHYSLAAEILRQCLEGLAGAHEHDVIHRDIKPANIFLVARGRQGPPVRLLDLGLARDLSECNRLTQTGQVVGTANLLAPEILLNKVGEAGTKPADVFAMGMVFFVMLTRRLPFVTEPPLGTAAAEMIYRSRFYKTQPVLPGPAKFEPSLPGRIDAFVRQALRLDPNERYADAGEMLTALASAAPAWPDEQPLIHEQLRNLTDIDVPAGLVWTTTDSHEVVPTPPEPAGTPAPANPAPTRQTGEAFPAAQPRTRMTAATEPRVSSVPPRARTLKLPPRVGAAIRLALSFCAVVALFVLCTVVTWNVLNHRAAARERTAPPRPPTRAALSPELIGTGRLEMEEVEVTLVGLPPGSGILLNREPVQGTVLRAPRHTAGLLQVDRPGEEPLRMVISFHESRSLDLATAFPSINESQGGDDTNHRAAGQRRGATKGQHREVSRRRPRPVIRRRAGQIQDPWAQ